jgi:hypothetical protein
MQCQHRGRTTIIDRGRSRRQRNVSPFDYDFATGGSSRSHGHTDIVLTLPLLFLMTVIFIDSPKKSKKNGVLGVLALGDGGLVEQPGAYRHRLDLAVALLDNRDFHD